jgi:hypothetical protein
MAEQRASRAGRINKSVQRALIFGVTPTFNWVYILMGKVLVFTPVTKILIITSSKLMAKEMSIPETRAGMIYGRVIS